MCNLSENYRLRECYLQRDEVPTQSAIRKSMGPLADVFFNTLCPRRKVLVGLEPPLKGAGADWYLKPEDLLEGRAVLKPLKNKAVAKLNHEGIDKLGAKVFKKRCKDMERERESVLSDGDSQWRASVASACKQLERDLHDAYSKATTTHVSNAYKEFASLYRKSLSSIEKLFHESFIADIKKTRENAVQTMQANYAEKLKHQTTILCDVYDKKLMEEKVKLRQQFEEKLEIVRTCLGHIIHDINVDKHVTVDHLKQYYERQNLACMMYVSIKERELCLAELEESKRIHQKIAKKLTESVIIKDYEIYIEKLKEKRRQNFLVLWHKKVAKVVKHFQDFVTHCLFDLPEHAEFFINMEKLMLLQISEVLENPSAESIIVVQPEEQLKTPVPQAKPFYLVCDSGYKAKLDQDLCPRHTGTASTAQLLPAIIVNKSCLYAACDSFEQFTNKIKAYIHGYDNEEIPDDLIYEHFQRFKYTPSQQQLELKLESSLMRVLQEEIDYVKQLPFKCSHCKMPLCVCLCSPPPSVSEAGSELVPTKPPIHLTPSQLLMHEQEPKWESYFNYVKPLRCTCGKTVMNDVQRHLPAYMRKATIGPPEIPEYEICPVSKLKELVKNAREEVPVPPSSSAVPVPKLYKDASTEYIEPVYEYMCTCLSDSEMETGRLLHIFADNKNVDKKWIGKPRLVGEDLSPSFMAQDLGEFATARAHSLMNLLKDTPVLEEIFDRDKLKQKRSCCEYEYCTCK
ncbi:uncharacterized protein LOC124638507 [Helicoverpa zea]|uniref:uncharacterized protein LOC124638507 n=1 Tax=Helicoverpa zea TaxID=7113 RepID=UPI001F5AE19E|nr:uncharacterized protein LOC124638507 [Helicoverpa zea]